MPWAVQDWQVRICNWAEVVLQCLKRRWAAMTQKSKRQLAYTASTHAVECLALSQDAIRLCEQISDGTISADAAVETLLRLYGLKQVNSNG